MASRLQTLKTLAKAAGYNITNDVDDVLPEDYPFLRAYLLFEKNIPWCGFSDVELENAGIKGDSGDGGNDSDENQETSKVGDAVVGEPESDSKENVEEPQLESEQNEPEESL